MANWAAPPAFGTTELKILEAAERLFSDSGLADVSARRLIAAAGQKNQRAIVYHFGDMDGVVVALIRLRRHTLNACERAELAAVPRTAGGPRPPLRCEVELERHVGALIWPSCDVMLQTNWGSRFIKILPALLLRLTPETRVQLPSGLWSSHAEVLRIYGELLPSLPERVRRERLRLASAMFANASSQWASRLLETPSASIRRRVPEAFAQMARMLATGLCAPADVSSMRPARRAAALPRFEVQQQPLRTLE